MVGMAAMELLTPETFDAPEFVASNVFNELRFMI